MLTSTDAVHNQWINTSCGTIEQDKRGHSNSDSRMRMGITNTAIQPRIGQYETAVSPNISHYQYGGPNFLFLLSDNI